LITITINERTEVSSEGIPLHLELVRAYYIPDSLGERDASVGALLSVAHSEGQSTEDKSEDAGGRLSVLNVK
jgi:hypothetical protein